MPPEVVSQSHPVVTTPSHRYYRGATKRAMITKKKKLIPILFFALSAASILGLLNTSVITSFSSPPASVSTEGPSKRTQPVSSGRSSTLTGKEFQLLSKIISLRAPCNLLVFGLEPQYLNLSSSINSGGTTVLLEDDPQKLKRFEKNQKNTRIYRVKYRTLARDAYKLLEQARQNPSCALGSVSVRKSSCPLSLMKLPREVYTRRWEVVVVDGPSGDGPDSPGRMAAIYTAGVMARAGNGTTDVVVHDVDRIIEKWFAWEFLCDDYLVSSKGRLWHFRIAGNSDPEKFCKDKTILVQL